MASAVAQSVAMKAGACLDNARCQPHSEPTPYVLCLQLEDSGRSLASCRSILFGLVWSGYSGPQLWSVVDEVRTQEPGGGPISSRLASMATDPDTMAPAARFARLALALIAGTHLNK